MPYQAKHQNTGESRDEEETIGGSAEEVIAALSEAGKQKLVNMILLRLIEDLFRMVLPLLSAKEHAEGEGGGADPLATAVAFDEE